jgi:hypothetical protein
LFLKTDGAGNLSFSSDLPTTSFTGATVETSIADSDLVLIYDDSATAVRKMTKANLVAGIGASAGQVIQVVSTNFTSTASSTSATFVDVSGFSATITPSSASNKILIIVDCNFGGSNDAYPAIKLFRASTEIFSGINGTGNMTNCFFGGAGISSPNRLLEGSRTVLDSPSTTSATTYKIQFANPYNSPTYAGHINRTDSLDNGAYTQSRTSGITLMEIKG